jgi:hypothetical protein
VKMKWSRREAWSGLITLEVEVATRVNSRTSYFLLQPALECGFPLTHAAN